MIQQIVFNTVNNLKIMHMIILLKFFWQKFKKSSSSWHISEETYLSFSSLHIYHLFLC